MIHSFCYLEQSDLALPPSLAFNIDSSRACLDSPHLQNSSLIHAIHRQKKIKNRVVSLTESPDGA